MIVLGCGDSSFQNIVHFILSNYVDFPANISAKNLLSNILLLVITVLKNIYINSCNINLIYFQHCYFRRTKKPIVFQQKSSELNYFHFIIILSSLDISKLCRHRLYMRGTNVPPPPQISKYSSEIFVPNSMTPWSISYFIIKNFLHKEAEKLVI